MFKRILVLLVILAQSATLPLMEGSRLELAELTAPDGAASFDTLMLDLAGQWRKK